jgi:membrane associated rhomboid family serine protease
MSDPAAPRWGGTPQAPASELARSGPLDPEVAAGLLQRAQALAQQGDWDLAADTFGRVVGHRDPNLHVAALLGLGECRFRMDDEPAAIQAWITATQAPETPFTWLAWKQLAASRVRSGDLGGAARAYREAERRAPPEARPEIASRLGWLAKETGDSGAAERYFRRTRADVVTGPIVTWTIIGITVLIGLATILFPERTLPLFSWLALIKSAVAEGEYWRLVTVVLVHDPNLILHLLFNMYALFAIGPVAEALYGPVRFLFIYLACAAAGSAASFVFSASPVSVGASGAIFGLFGLVLIADRVHKPALTRNARTLTMQIGVLIAINLVIGLTIPRIDNAAHIGGLLAGCWLGLVMVPKGAARLRSFWQQPGTTTQSGGTDGSRLVGVLGVIALMAVIAVGVWVGPSGLRLG